MKLRKIIEKSPIGKAHARNIGVRKAKGDFIIFIDSDVMVEKHYFSLLIKEISKLQGNFIGIQGVHWLYRPLNFITFLYSLYRKRHAVEHLRKHDDFFVTNRIDTRNFVIRRSIISRFGFNEDLISEEDRELGDKITRTGLKIVFTKNLKVYHIPINFWYIISHQIHYGRGAVIWRKSFWNLKKYFVEPMTKFLTKEIGFNLLFITLVCNFFYLFGGIFEVFRRFLLNL